MRKEGKKVYSDKEYRQRKKTNWWKPFKKQLADLKKKRDKLLGTNSKRRAKNWVFESRIYIYIYCSMGS